MASNKDDEIKKPRKITNKKTQSNVEENNKPEILKDISTQDNDNLPKYNPLPEKDSDEYTPDYSDDLSYDDKNKSSNIDEDEVVVGGVVVDQDVLKKTRADKSERRKSIILYIIIALLVITWVFIGFMFYRYKALTEVSRGVGSIILEGDGESGDLDFAVYTAKYDDAENPVSFERLTEWPMPYGIQGGVDYSLNLWVENLDDNEVSFRIWVQLKNDDTVLTEFAMNRINMTNFSYSADASIMYYYYTNEATGDTLAPNQKVKFANIITISNSYTSLDRHNCFINIYVEVYRGQHDWNIE